MSQTKKKPEKPNLWRNFIVFIVIFIVIAAVLSLYQSPFSEELEEVGVNQLVLEVNNDNVKELLFREMR